MVDPKQFKGELILSRSCRKYSPLGEEGNGGEQGDRKSVSDDHLTSAVKIEQEVKINYKTTKLPSATYFL